MRTIGAAIIVSMIATSALAADADSSLAPGRPAGVQQAQRDGDNTVLYVVGLGVVAAGIALVASGSGHKSGSGGSVTTATSTAP